MSVIEHDLGDTATTSNPDDIAAALRILQQRGHTDLAAALGLDGKPGRCTHRFSTGRVCHLDEQHTGDHQYGGVWR